MNVINVHGEKVKTTIWYSCTCCGWVQV